MSSVARDDDTRAPQIAYLGRRVDMAVFVVLDADWAYQHFTHVVSQIGRRDRSIFFIHGGSWQEVMKESQFIASISDALAFVCIKRRSTMLVEDCFSVLPTIPQTRGPKNPVIIVKRLQEPSLAANRANETRKMI